MSSSVPSQSDDGSKSALGADHGTGAQPLPRDARTLTLTHDILAHLGPGDDAALHNHTDFDVDSWSENNATHPTKPLVLGEYLVEGLIGRGGMGQVFRARHRMMDRTVALKILPADFATNPELVDRFFLEVKSLGKLLHPNIVTAFDAGQSNSIYYLVMELIEGQSLSGLVDSQGPLSVEQTVDVIYQVAKALEYAHSRGMIHRDIKPSNIMMTASGQVKILDFGLVRLTGESSESIADQRRNLMGTVEYMSPEQIQHSAKIDHRADLYSLGATLFYILTGEAMFTGEPVRIALSHLQETPPVLYEVRGDVDLRLDALFQRLVAKNPDERFDSAAHVLNYLDQSNLRSSSLEKSHATISVTREIGRVLRDHPTRGFAHRSTMRREFNAIGIDLGMKTSQACFVDASLRAVPIQLDETYFDVPNVIWSHKNQLLIGRKAVEARIAQPEHAFHTLQRWLGVQRVDRDFGGRGCPPEVILAALIRHVVNQATPTARDVSHAVVTIPSCFDQLRRVSLATACKIAGIEVLQLLDKHLAASLAFALPTKNATGDEVRRHDKPVTHQLVLTLTGSAAEAAVVRCEGKLVKTVATYGDTQMSLLRWQSRLAEYFWHRIQSTLGVTVREDIRTAAKVQRVVERTLESLFTTPRAIARVKLSGHQFEWVITQQQLLTMCATEYKAFEGFVTSALQQSQISIDEIDEVILIGTALQSKHLSALRQQAFGKNIPELVATQADVARGAAMQASYLIPPGIPDGYHASGATPFDLGIALRSGKLLKDAPRVFLPRFTSIPTTSSRTLRVDRPTSEDLFLQFVESSRSDSKWNWLAAANITQAFPKIERKEPLQLRLRVDGSGIWSATLIDLSHNEQLSISSVADYPFTDNEIANWNKWLETTLLCNL